MVLPCYHWWEDTATPDSIRRRQYASKRRRLWAAEQLSDGDSGTAVATAGRATPIVELLSLSDADLMFSAPLTNNLGTILLNGWDEPIDIGDMPVTFDVQIDDTPQLHIEDQIIEITHARVTGTIRCSPKAVPIEDSCYLENDRGEPFAAALLIEFQSALWGFSASARNQELRMFRIPPILRNTRPIRRPI